MQTFQSDESYFYSTTDSRILSPQPIHPVVIDDEYKSMWGSSYMESAPLTQSLSQSQPYVNTDYKNQLPNPPPSPIAYLSHADKYSIAIKNKKLVHNITKPNMFKMFAAICMAIFCTIVIPINISNCLLFNCVYSQSNDCPFQLVENSTIPTTTCYMVVTSICPVTQCPSMVWAIFIAAIKYALFLPIFIPLLHIIYNNSNYDNGI
jgi:hypothetical protein